MIGGLVAIVAFVSSLPHPPAAFTAAGASVAAAPADTSTTVADAAYADPDRKQVERALKEEQTLYASGGLSSLARRSQACFQKLAQSPSYGELDFCLAFDAYAMGRAVGDMGGVAGIPQGSYFADTASRAQQAATTVMAGQSDPAARIEDIRQLATQVAAAAATDAAGASPADVDSHTPSFDCATVTSENLQLVCAVPALADDDQDLAEAYRAALARSTNPAALQATQQKWITARNRASNDIDALHALYRARIKALGAS